jgi:acyl-coenzyme A thioesterase PaaI-like protein
VGTRATKSHAFDCPSHSHTHTHGADGRPPLPLLLQIHLLRPALGPLLRAEATVLRPGRQFHVVEAKVFSLPDPTPGLGSGTSSGGQAQGEAPRLVAWLTATIAVVAQRTPQPSAL